MRLNLIGIILLLVSLGCGSAQQRPAQEANVAPESKAALETMAENIQSLKQNVQQIQTTTNKMESNFQLDANRAKLEMARDEQSSRSAAATVSILVGLILIGLASPQIDNLKIRTAIMIMAILLIAAGTFSTTILSGIF
jgi:hypothetical protein